MAQFAVNGFVIHPAEIEAGRRAAAPSLSLGQRDGRKIHHLVERVEKMAVSFARHFPGVVRLSGRGDLHRFGKTGRARLRALVKFNLLVRKPVFALGAVFGQCRGFAIALEAENDAARAFPGDQHLCPKARFDLGLLLVALCATLKCVVVG
jgi:hypothetical protein